MEKITKNQKFIKIKIKRPYKRMFMGNKIKKFKKKKPNKIFNNA